jgi:hypothetical protein
MSMKFVCLPDVIQPVCAVLSLLIKTSVISMTILGQGKLSPDERDLYLRQASKMRQLDDEIPEDESTVEGSLTQERFDELAVG